MTDKLTPGQLRDLADLVDDWEHIGPRDSRASILREEASRRAAEAKELGRAAERIGEAEPLPGSASATVREVVDPKASAKGPDSAATEAPAPADDLRRRHERVCDIVLEWCGGAPTPEGRQRVVALATKIDAEYVAAIAAQAREIAYLKRIIENDTASLEAQAARADRAEADNARLREALAPFAEAARKAEASGRPPFQFCSADDYTRAASASGGERV